jgi:hypothetical protein
LARLTVVIVFLAALATAQVPLGTFAGTVRGISDKQITIEKSDGNLVDLEINHKTKILRRKKRIRPDDIMTGDQVTIEAREVMLQFLVAVVITVQAPQTSTR